MKLHSFILIALLSLLPLSLAQKSPTQSIPEIKTNTSLSYAERMQWHTVLDWPQSYEQSFLNTFNPSDPSEYGGIQFYELMDDWYLVEIQTYRGAYQGGTIFMLYNQSWEEGYLVGFPSASLNDAGSYSVSSQIEVSGYITFDDETKELEIFSRSRGPGGCGSLNRYRFQYEFAYLISIRSQSCAEADAQSENMILSPSDWPLVWPPQTDHSGN